MSVVARELATQRRKELADAIDVARKACSPCAPTDSGNGWRQFGIPLDSGNGFDYNLDYALWFKEGRIVTERAILQISTAWACIRLLANTIACLPLSMYQREPDGDRDAAPEHPLYSILHDQPNADMTATDYWQVILALLLLRGNAVSEKDMIGNRLVGLTPLPCVSWARQPDGRYRYTVTQFGKTRILDESQVWHLPAFTMDGHHGLSPICYGSKVFGGASAADIASRSIFENGMKASGFVTFPQGSPYLSKEQRTQFHDTLAEFSGSRKAGRSFVLEGGATYNPITMNPDDAQMLETRGFSVEEICRWFGVPPTLVGHGDKTSNWGTGLEQQNQSFLTYGLQPWLKKIESSIRKNLLSPADKTKYFAEFGVEGLLRADTAGRAAFYSSMTQNGIFTRDDCRQKENLPRVGGNADVLTVQSALVPLNDLGKPKPAAPGAPGDTPPTDPAANLAPTPDSVRAALRAAFPLLTDEEISAMIAPAQPAAVTP